MAPVDMMQSGILRLARDRCPDHAAGPIEPVGCEMDAAAIVPYDPGREGEQ